LYVLTHDLLHKLGRRFSQLLADSGVIPADRENMDAAMETGHSVMVLPGAARETFRTYKRRREIDLGGRTGFIAQAIRWRVPITPVVSAGAHETMFVLSSGYEFARKVGLRKIVRAADAFPILAGLPWGVWALPFLPQLPLPSKITVEVLEPIWLPRALGRPLSPADADDPDVLMAGRSLVLARMRERLDRLYDERKWPVLG
jgi:1-acyl-sn-glycerol-3-phosphate acyltransferase